MTQQQVNYMNAVTQRRSLDIAQQEANAATKQAEVAAKRQAFEEGKKYWTDLGTGIASTIGGIMSMLLL